MPEIKSLPEIKDYPGANPLRIKTLQVLRGMASDPTSLEVMPLGGMVRALKGKKVYHGFSAPKIQGRLHSSWTEASIKAEMILEAKYGKKWILSSKHGEWSDLTDKLLKQSEKEARRKQIFTKFDPSKAGSGAGGNLYDKGIYLSEHPKVSSGYGSVVRKHNIPPQAKIFDIERNLTLEEMDKVAEALENSYAKNRNYTALPEDVAWRKEKFRQRYPDGAKLKELTTSNGDISHIVTGLGYDGISYNAGKVMGLPPGVKEGTKNYVIYNYDIINNPRKLVPKPEPQPDKALRRFPSPRDKHLQQKREATKKAMDEARKPTREEVEYMVKKRGMFSY